jgi:NTE family protein
MTVTLKTTTHKPERKRLNLALQGGGAHGAFTWGVLDRLMSDRRIFIDGLSGTSAGAMNAVVFVDGFIKGGRKGAIDALRVFWKAVSERALMSSGHALMPGFLQGGDGEWNVDNHPAFMWADIMTRMFSPYQVNPLNINPLRDILTEQVDFAALRKRTDIKLYVSATNVRTCKLKVFRTHEMYVEALLASACLPLTFQAVEFQGEQYWDGGYLANPAISPLIHECVSKDVLIVQINPMNRAEAPTSAREILNRVNEVSFNATLAREMSGFVTISKLIDGGKLRDTAFHRVNFHMIAAEDEMSRLGASSKSNADWRFLTYLYELGVKTADKWLEENFDCIGVESTLDMVKAYA